MYEDYMQNILGYRMNPQQNTNMYEQYNMQGGEWQQYDNYMPTMQYGNQMSNNMNIDLESCYPEIYKIIYPMIRNVCMRNTEPITEEVIDRMVNEVYTNIETGDVITLNINLGNSVTTGETVTNTTKEGNQNRETESRQRNFLMNDLIRILLIRELLRRQGGNRPPFPPRPFPPRPPMGRPPMNRPPIMPRYEEYPNY